MRRVMRSVDRIDTPSTRAFKIWTCHPCDSTVIIASLRESKGFLHSLVCAARASAAFSAMILVANSQECLPRGLGHLLAWGVSILIA
jgi:hypothetical protein